MRKTWAVKSLRSQLFMVTFLVGFLFGTGLTTLDRTGNNLYGFGLIVFGLGAAYFQVNLVVKRETRAGVVAEQAGRPADSPCVLEIHVHRGEIVDATGTPVDPAQQPPTLCRVDALSLQATLQYGPDVDFGKLAAIVHRFADGLDKTHHERVSQAN